ncbi:MAG: hypothetical protein KC496_19320 [Anaerolineae bacterium]|nr:hypothetical protein [Anaerolineae bacterium]
MIQRTIRFFLLLGVFTCLLPVVAQQELRDYAITNTNVRYTEDETAFIIDVVVTNQGGNANRDTEAIFTIPAVDQEIRQTIPPLLADQSVTLSTSPLPFSDYPDNELLEVDIEVGIDLYVELPGSRDAENNVATVTVPIPARTTSLNPLSVENFSVGDFFRLEDNTVIIGDQVFSREEFALGLLAIATVIIVLWLFTVIFRLIFRRSPSLGTWQPPYAMAPYFDQNSTEGRRQSWQQYAQNNLLLAAPTENNLHAVKMLVGADGGNLVNWKLTGLRLSQYDSYGRIARSQMVARKKWVKRLNLLIKKHQSEKPERLNRRAQAVARGLIGDFRKKVSRKNAFLPIALDVRFVGQHGEVRIFFELYQCNHNAWYLLDQWEPTMLVLAQKLQENFTFTMHGKNNAENLREFYQRLQEDLAWLLLEMLRAEQTVPQTSTEPRAVELIPDTLTDMEPITDPS